MPRPAIFIREKLLKVFPPHRILDDDLSISSVAVDASLYQIKPCSIVDVMNDEEMASLMKICAQEQIPLTFRAAGTSLSGQAQGAGILARISRGFKKLEVLEQGNKIKLGVGVIGAKANEALKIYAQKIGPDPASIHSCMIGGMIANNASGMCCGIDQNSYRTIAEMRLLLPPRSELESVVQLDTGSCTSRDRLRALRPDIIDGLKKIRTQIHDDLELKSKIEKKYRIKNTMGYSLNAFLDYEDPIDILSHLMVGSEGTLGFVSEVTYKTVPDPKLRACAFVVFRDLAQACASILELKKLSIRSAELMDRTALRSVENHAGVPKYLRDLSDDAAVLLIETRAEDQKDLQAKVDQIQDTLLQLDFNPQIEFSYHLDQIEQWWNVRRGLFPSVAKGRKPGTTVIIEDIAVPVSKLSEAAVGLKNLLDQHGYTQAVIFGHALDGNLHFVFTQNFTSAIELNRYESLMSELSVLVVDQWEGSLKAEHGTGRNMAPFLEKEWGEKATQIMWEIKDLIDPLQILNPDVILSRDSRLHLKSIKNSPAIDPLIDDCMECGFCETHCPSSNLTLTPRQRIAAFRESGRLEDHSQFLKKFDYSIDQTCATDGMCALSCPVGIDTGQWIKKVRSQKSLKTQIRARLALLIARKMSLWLFLPKAVFLFLRTFKSNPKLKHLSTQAALNAPLDSSHSVIYFPSCISRSMTKSLPDTMIGVLEQAGYRVLIPKKIQNQCCGLPFESKGYLEASDLKIKNLESELWELSQQGDIPLIVDTSPCTAQLQKKLNSKLKIFDSISFIHRYLLSGQSPNPLTFRKTQSSVTVHSTCSTQKMGLTRELISIASACSESVIIPQDVECCGFAGDKGWTHPELTASALHHLSTQVKDHCQEGFSSSPTCEVGLSRASGIPYRSIVYAVARAIGLKSP